MGLCLRFTQKRILASLLGIALQLTANARLSYSAQNIPRAQETDCLNSQKLPLEPKEMEELLAYLKHHYKLEPPSPTVSFIEQAAESFDLPSTFLACLYVKESGPKIDPKLRSPAGAIGLAQLMPETIQSVAKIIRTGSKAKIDDPRMETHKEMLKAKWADYWNKQKRKGPAPTSFNRNDALHPQSAVAAGALWAKLYETEIARQNPKASPFDLLILTSGAYNLGITKFSKICDKLNAQDCQSQLYKKKFYQTSHHMDATRRCLEAGNWDPMLKQRKK